MFDIFMITTKIWVQIWVQIFIKICQSQNVVAHLSYFSYADLYQSISSLYAIRNYLIF